jgi:hypothetical protein
MHAEPEASLFRKRDTFDDIPHDDPCGSLNAAHKVVYTLIKRIEAYDKVVNEAQVIEDIVNPEAIRA